MWWYLIWFQTNVAKNRNFCIQISAKAYVLGGHMHAKNASFPGFIQTGTCLRILHFIYVRIFIGNAICGKSIFKGSNSWFYLPSKSTSLHGPGPIKNVNNPPPPATPTSQCMDSIRNCGGKSTTCEPLLRTHKNALISNHTACLGEMSCMTNKL